MAKPSYYATAEPYQLRVRDFIFDNPRCGVWAEMGLRKTGITLSAAVGLLHLGEVERILVVAPKRVAEHQWPAEIRKWREFEGLTHTLLRGEPSWRMSLTNRQTNIHIINYELLEWLCNVRANSWPYDWIIFDESDSLKSPTSIRFRVSSQLVSLLDKLAERSGRPQLRITQLTGTPSSNGLVDLWAPMYLLDYGAALGNNFDSFKMRWFVSQGYGVRPREHAEEIIHRRVAHLVVSLQQKDYLQLPDIVYNKVHIPLPPKARSQYDELEEEAVLFLAKSDGGLKDVVDELEGDGEERVTAFTAAAKINKCLQVASGAVFITDPETGLPSREWREIHRAKIDALKDIISEAAGETVMVVYWYKHDLDRLREAFPQGRVITESNAAIDAWNRQEIPVGFLSAASGYGLNLQDGGHIIVWFSMVWSLRLFQQTNARLHRSGQGKPVFVHMLLAERTFDEDVPLRLEGKATTQELLMRRVKALRDQGKVETVPLPLLPAEEDDPLLSLP